MSRNEMLKVTTSCLSRFWIFDQAAQLERHGMLHRLVTGYPKFMTRRWNIPDEKVTTLLANGLHGRYLPRVASWFGNAAENRTWESVNNAYSARLAHHVPLDSDVFIGLSASCLEAIRFCKQRGILAIVDHGSINMRTKRRLLIDECARWGLDPEGCAPPLWVIEKEDEEFHTADRVMVLSHLTKRTMIQEGIPGDKIFVNHSGVDISRFQPTRKRDSVFRVIHSGGLILRKGVQYLLQAFHELDLPNSELWFVGAGADSKFMQPIFDRFRSPKIHYKGAFPQSALPEIYSQGSVFVLASVGDGFGMVVSQAMACGLPAIVSENAGGSDIISEGNNGFVLPLRDVETLKKHLLYLYENPEERRRMAIEARQSVQTGLTWDDYGDRLADFLTNTRAKGLTPVHG